MPNKSEGAGRKSILSTSRYLNNPAIRQWMLLGCFVIFWLNSSTPILRFDTDTIWNDVSFMVMLSAFPLLAVNSLFFRNRLFKWAGVIIFFMLTIISLIGYFFLYSHIQQINSEGHDSSFNRVNQFKTDGNLICIYQSGSVFGKVKYRILVRQEKIIFSHLRIVKDLYKENDSFNVDVRVVDAYTIEINTLSSNRNNREWATFHLKKYVYF